MLETVQKAALALADNPLTTKAVIAASASSATGRFFDVLPDVISITGLLIAGVAGVLLGIRHWKVGKLDDTRRRGAEMQNAHDAKIQELQLERVQLELERFKAEIA